MDLTGTAGTASRFQHYKLLRRPDGTPWELGRGTMGVTYKAFDVNLRCEVALKVVNPALIHHPNARERFIREARAAARLRHRNIASVYHLGNDEERFFYAMEFIDGETLDALVRRQGPFPADGALRVLLQVARALAAAARQGVIHRDIKPGNLMVVHEDDDEHQVVKLIDFGLARAVAVDDEPGNLTANGFVGTPVYSSPEQMAEKPADARSDIYSLGVTAWFLLVGRAPFNGTVASIFQQHATKPPPWENLPASVPAPVRALLARMLEKDPAKRPQSAVELRQEIDACRERLAAPRQTAGPRPAERRAASPPPVAAANPPREIGPGMILKGRYELLRLVGEGNSGRVFQVRDRGANDEARALKVLRPEVTGDTSQREEAAEEFALIQGAPHANLIRLHALVRLETRAVDFLVEEWLQGFTLRDLLAVRGGTLPAGEALRVLAQAAAAVDHAAARGFHRLDLALHQLHVHFPTLPTGPGDDAGRETMSKGLADWPRWVLKINPFGAAQDGLESSTWAGELTHLPGPTPPHERDLLLEEQSESPAAGYLRGLARLMYEILGGAPTAPEDGPESRPRYVSLPALSEPANAVLQAALTEDPPPYETSRDFYVALAEATGNKVWPPAEARPGREADRASQTFRGPVSIAVRAPAKESDPALTPADREEFAAESSAWERVSQSSGGRGFRSWLPTALVGLVVVVGAMAVFAAITQRKAPTKKPSAATTPRPVAVPSVAASARPSSTPRLALSIPPASREPSPTPVAVVTVPVETPQGTPPPLAPTPAPKETIVKVRVETKPAGAEIRLAGKTLGTTPLEVSLPAGDHQLVARYRNWPEVHHNLHLDNSQLTALDEIHMIPPTLVPTGEGPASPSPKPRPLPSPTPHRDTPRPTPRPAGDGLIYFPTPTASGAPSNRGLEPFLSTPPRVRRARPVPNPADLDGGSQPETRRRNPETLDSGDGED